MRALHRQPLRVTLALLVVVLVSAGLAVSSVIATASLRGYLVDRIDEQLFSGSRVADRDGAGPPPAREPEDQEGRPPSLFYLELVPVDGSPSTVLSVPATSEANTPAVPAAADLAALVSTPLTVGSSTGDGEWRLLVTESTDGTAYAVAAFSLDDVSATVARLAFLQVLVGGAVVLVAAVVGFVLVRRSLRPLDDLAETATAVAAGDLSLRVSEKASSTEVDEVARSFNTMVARIESAFAAQQSSESAARSSEERMRRFVADAGHELRTPLTSIRGYAELVSEGAAPDPHVAIERIQSEADRMSSVVEELLMLARLDQEQPLQLTEVDLADIAREAVERAELQDAGHRWEFTGDPVTVRGDAHALSRALDNLLSNASRYADPGTVVEIDVAALDAHQARVTVKDHGPGLSPDQASRVFDRLYRTDEARSRVSGGHGLGLAIVRSIVEAHRGEVFIESAPGSGSAFGFVLPTASASASA